MLQKVSSQERCGLAYLSLVTKALRASLRLPGYPEALCGFHRPLSWLLWGHICRFGFPSAVCVVTAVYFLAIVFCLVTTGHCKAGWAPLPSLEATVTVFAPGSGTLTLFALVSHVGHSVNHWEQPLFILTVSGTLLAFTNPG